MNRRPVKRNWLKDGVGDRRTPISATYRPTQLQYDQLAAVAKAYGLTVEQLLARALKQGVDILLQEARESGVQIPE